MPDWWMLNAEDLHNKGKEDIIDPTVNDDSSKGYKVSSHWVNLINDNAFICVDSTIGSAVWKQVDPVTGLLNNLDATTDPDADEDSGDGYSVGSRWINVTLDKEFVCLDSTLTSAVWKETTAIVTLILDKVDATVDPTVDNDNTEGYSVGSHWMNITADETYVCLDASTGAAVWNQVDDTGLLNKFDATVAPVATNDNTEGYAVGSNWVDVTADKAYRCVDATTDAAVWILVGGNGLLNKYDATVAPVATNDNTEGYSIGSEWVDVTADKAYVCLDITTDTAIWKETTQLGGSSETSSTTNYDIGNAVYDSKFVSVNSEDTGPTDIFIKPDGTKMYILGGTNDTVFQYSLSEDHDVSTATYDGVSFSIASEDNIPVSIFFKDDGTKMYVLGQTNLKVYQYTLPTPWVLTGMSYDSVFFSVASEDATTPRDIFFKDNGTKMYMAGSTSDTVYQYTLPTPWVLTGMSYDSVFFSLASEDTAPTGLVFKSDGTKVYVLGQANNGVFQYNLPTPWVLTGMSYDSIFISLVNEDTTPRNLFLKGDGSKMYMLGSFGKSVYQYTAFTEINTGRVWAPNGKPIFRRTVALADTGVGGNETIALGVVIDIIIDIGGYVIRDSDSVKLPLPYVDASANLNVEAHINSAGTDVVVTSGSSQNHNGGFIWIEYTK